MPKPQYEFHRPRQQWTPAGGPVAGVWEQILARDPHSGDYTRLMRFEPGTDTTPNGPLAHDFHEEVYIVDGDLTDLTLGQTFNAGMYASRLPGMPHGPWRSDSGVLMVEFRHGFPR
ncbi:cupin domain-containing protein [Dactylosporangium sp. CA-092794]|uniref:cupin domain-containing protein n=1 Tax=Dactylosporangium sp. CA-092794 TaxID=3239929 RepID=UPI003D93B2BD